MPLNKHPTTAAAHIDNNTFGVISVYFSLVTRLFSSMYISYLSFSSFNWLVKIAFVCNLHVHFKLQYPKNYSLS